MAFFKAKPNVSDHDKARIEFHLQEIAESIGFERFVLPVVSEASLMDHAGKTPQQIVAFASEHLSHNTAGLSVQVAIVPEEKCGGGG
jgi:hypothetical protein